MNPLGDRPGSEEVWRRFQKWTVLMPPEVASEFWDDVYWLMRSLKEKEHRTVSPGVASEGYAAAPGLEAAIKAREADDCDASAYADLESLYRYRWTKDGMELARRGEGDWVPYAVLPKGIFK